MPAFFMEIEGCNAARIKLLAPDEEKDENVITLEANARTPPEAKHISKIVSQKSYCRHPYI
ncbi:hypothetical protein [Brevibacillus laterosporus]|uniref:hypothetical protein n=1 Tax=Brevibacillus laterosporus TaxID=1465 RepID=UPI00265CE586|nr:hypothetical protein [Brevibacillus laterosporus]